MWLGEVDGMRKVGLMMVWLDSKVDAD